MEHPEIKFHTATLTIKKPKRMKTTDASFLICNKESLLVWAGSLTQVLTGVQVDVPKGYVGLLTLNNHIARNKKIAMINSPMIIDSASGQGIEFSLHLISISSYERVSIPADSPIAKLTIVPCNTCASHVTSNLDSDLGDGSTHE